MWPVPDSYEQDPKQSVIDERGAYSYTQFSIHEATVIRTVLSRTIEKYPADHRALGLTCEACSIAYKPRHILFKVILDEYPAPQKPYDILAIAIAEYNEGYYYYESAIEHFNMFFEKANFKILSDLPPAYNLRAVYLIIVKIYEAMGDGEKAISYYKKAADCKWNPPEWAKEFWTDDKIKKEQERQRTADNMEISKLQQKMENSTPKPLKKMGAKRKATEDQILAASRFFFAEVREDWYTT